MGPWGSLVSFVLGVYVTPVQIRTGPLISFSFISADALSGMHRPRRAVHNGVGRRLLPYITQLPSRPHGRREGLHVRGAPPDRRPHRLRVRHRPRVPLRLQGPRGQPSRQRLRFLREDPEGHGSLQDGRVLRQARGGSRGRGRHSLRGLPPRRVQQDDIQGHEAAL